MSLPPRFAARAHPPLRTARSVASTDRVPRFFHASETLHYYFRPTASAARHDRGARASPAL